MSARGVAGRGAVRRIDHRSALRDGESPWWGPVLGGALLVLLGAYLAAVVAGAGFGVAFAGAMFGLVTADDLMVLFIFWEITSVLSFLLISYSRTKLAARRAALQALIITTAGGVMSRPSPSPSPPSVSTSSVARSVPSERNSAVKGIRSGS